MHNTETTTPPNHSPLQISACIVCRNEADKLEPCLQSVSWADEIIVMDLSSTDGSADLARQYGAQVILREPHPIVEPLRNEVAAAARGNWILALDPDERVTPGLAEELRRLAQRENIDAIAIPRMNVDLGHPPSQPLHRYEEQIRMYRRGAVTWPVVPNTLPQIPPHRLYHIAHRDELVLVHERNRNIPEILERITRYAPAEAQAMIDQGEVFSARRMLSTLLQKAYLQYYVGKPWQDGVPGLLRATILLAYHFYVWAAFWHQSGGKRSVEDDQLVKRLGIAVEWSGRCVLLMLGIYRIVATLLRKIGKGRHKALF